MKINIKLFLKLIFTLAGLIFFAYLGFLACFFINIKNNNFDKAYKKADLICRYGLKKNRETVCVAANSLSLINDLSKAKEGGQIIWDDKVFDQIPEMIAGIESAEKYLDSVVVKAYFKLRGKGNELEEIKDGFDNFNQNKDKINNLIEILPKLIGVEESSRYTLLLQNNMELRATGGFMGSYAQAEMKNGAIADFYVQDIYVPDGQLTAHVNPPDPIAQAFRHGFWKLRDSNWSPDFAFSAEKQIAWFLERGNEKPGDTLVAVNLSLVEELMKVVGPIYLSDYEQEINSNNFYAITQYESEVGFFPGSTQKRDFLSQLADNILIKLENLDYLDYLQIINKILLGLERKDIQIFSFDENVQAVMEENIWAGRLNWDQDSTNDYQMIVESNLGANKANCCVVKNVSQSVKEDGGNYLVNLQINFENNSPVDRPKPPKYWGGDYRDFLRIYLTEKALIENISLDGEILKEEDISKDFMTDSDLKEYGFWANVNHQNKLLVEINYRLPKEGADYSLTLQKQSGAADFWQEFELEKDGQILKTKKLIDRDMVIKF